MSWYKSKIDKVKNYATSFWYDDYETSFDYLEEYGTIEKKDLDAYKKTQNLYKLASVRRAISNFVQIVTNKSIPVTFAVKSDSKTDGKHVILSADVDDNFDVSVGLALHEGSHIILSDFEMLKTLHHAWSTIKQQKFHLEYTTRRQLEAARQDPLSDVKYVVDMNEVSTIVSDQMDKQTENYIRNQNSKYYQPLMDVFHSSGKIASRIKITDEVFDTISGITNWIEDRRIDQYIYKTAPGYRDYYLSMYNYYFNDKIVTKGIKSDEFTDETIDSYMFRIINLLNEETNLSKLKGLRSIYRLLDLKSISRLTNSIDSLNLATDIFVEILKNIPIQNQTPTNGGENGENQSESGTNAGGSSDFNPNQTDDEDNQMGGANGSADVNGQASGEPTPSNGDEGKDLLSESALRSLMSKIKKQKDFINGTVKKKQITKTENDKLLDITESGTELVRVGSDYTNHNGNRIGKGVDCIVVKKLTKKILESNDFPFTNKNWKSDALSTPYEEEVKRGSVLGTLLGKKLQIRSESRETVFSRLKKGKIDGRQIASLGFDNENVFYQRDVDQYKKANLHISIDYSGSMQGDKLRKAIVSTIAIVKACYMARNINTQVSIRSTDTGAKALPYVALVHDSRRDSFKQFCYYMSALNCTNTTPEGLCFEAIMKQLIPSTNDVDSYFLNFSDGQPTYHISSGGDDINYSGKPAAEHTRQQVKKMQVNGINVLSYFITEYSEERFQSSHDWETFKQSYGNDAKYINVQNMMEVAKTMNELFLKKSN